MRIAVITQYFPSSAQPWQGNSAYQTIRLLAQQHQVRVFYPESRYPALLTPRSRTHAALDPAWQPAGVSVEYIPYTAVPVLTRPLNGFLIDRALRNRVRAYAPEIILSYVVYPDGFAATRIAHALNVPSVLTAIGSDLNRIPDRLCARHTRWTLAHATHTTTVSRALLQTAQTLGADPTHSTAILNGCDPSIFHPGDRASARSSLHIAPDAELVLYVGRLDLRKGLAELIQAVAILSPQRPNLRCMLVGEGPDKPLLTQLIAQYSLDNVDFIPAQPASEVALYMAAADLVTLPSYNEGCPNVVIEALASGRPVVATDVGGIPELMDGRSGDLVPPRDVPILAKALDDVLSRPWKADAISRRHTRSWADVALDLEQLLESCLAKKS